MTDEERLLAKRFEELSSRGYNKGIWVYSDFLNTAQQALLQSLKLGAVSFYGGSGPLLYEETTKVTEKTLFTFSRTTT